MTQPELIVDVPCQLGENPLWHPLEKRVYWTDIIAGKLFRYDPETGRHEECFSGATVGGFTIQADGALLLFMAHGAIARWQAGRLDYLIEASPAEWDNRFNDVIADPAGRVFCGYLPIDVGSRPGGLCRLDLDGSMHPVLDGIGISNGIGFSLDCKHMYYTDSSKRQIYRFDYDQGTGALTHQRVWLETPADAGVPDGLTVDAEGHLWSARWDGSALYRYTPDGVEELRIDFPARKVSSLTFGGDDLSDIYVTTALDGGSRANEGPGAGGFFRLRPGIRGKPEFFSRIKLR